MTISLRDAHTNAARDPGQLSAGVRSWSAAGPDALPFTSLRRLADAFRWPGPFSYSHEWPHEMTAPRGPRGEWSDCGQGIVSDGTCWYLVIEDALWYFGGGPVKPLPADQEAVVEQDGVVFRGRRQLVDTRASIGPVHLSSPALLGNRLLVPAEGNPYPADGGLWVWLFDTATLGYVGRFLVEGTGGEFSWCAVSADGRLLYTTHFSEDAWIDSVRVYRIPPMSSFSGAPSARMAIDSISAYPSLRASRVGDLPLRDVDGSGTMLGRVQSGCVSPNGHLYIGFEAVRKAGAREHCRGVLGYDLLTGQAVRYISSDRGDELEGVYAGRDGVHVLHNDEDASSNEFTISHYVVSAGEGGLI